MSTEGLFKWIQDGENEKAQSFLLENPKCIGESNGLGVSPLLMAAYCRNQEMVEFIASRLKKMSLYEAASIGALEIVENQLISTPELLDTFAPDGFTALGLASFFGQTAVVKYLLGLGANPSLAANNAFQVAPLHSACASSHHEIAALLIAAGAGVNAPQQQGVTPLHSAAHNGNVALVELLIKNGADISAQTTEGKTPADMAQEKGFPDLAHRLRP
ncbi:ankyrin repeat domain-containing protein [Cytophagales bacterium LB-30]|uniref:Ankyrin repeat domain-containing protein n=1 Tax=Shiella aurantiaca TaxID=3058365 RepID=A0ABT8F728_9BACT|nr:ankyrin repeat domain-containing protein [Shiella aurantiaca]MDN4166287.1 ankyrin repeat domain-containing protein [Shiella aurantiaca]